MRYSHQGADHNSSRADRQQNVERINRSEYFVVAFLFSFFSSPVFLPVVAAKLELSNHGHFVILDVDGSRGLVVGLQSDTIEEVISGSLRLALGGILNSPESLFVQVARGCWKTLESHFGVLFLNTSTTFEENRLGAILN